MRTSLATAALLATTIAAAGPLAAFDGKIGIYGDLTATETSAVFSLGVPRTLFIVAQVDGRTTAGISGAEFRIDGLPADWTVFVMPNPTATISLGDPFRSVNDTQRANIVWGTCTQAPDGRILLYTAIIVANSVLESGDLVVRAGDPPTNQNWTTPIMTLCDAPNFTGVEAQGDSFHLRTRAPQDLDYSERTGYDGVRGVQPQKGLPGDVFHFRVVYASADAVLPAAGSPRLELDANGDGDALDPGEGAFTMSPADLDSTLANGKEYRFDIALGAPPGGEYRYRFTAIDQRGTDVPGAATAWRESLFVNAELADLRVFAEDVRVVPPNPRPEDLCTIVAKVQNRSERRVDGVTVRIENVDGAVIAERTLAYMAPRSSTEVVCSWQFSYSGFYPVLVRVDPNNDIPESDESNNDCSHGVFVGTGTTGNLTINGLPPTITVPPAAPFSVLGYATYSLGAPPHYLVRGAAVVSSPSWQESQSTRTDNAGEFVARFIAPAVPGTYALVVHVDDGSRADSAVVEVVSAAMGLPPQGPDLTVQMTASPAAGCPAGTADVAWTVANHGDQSSQPTTVRLLAGTQFLTEVAVGALVPGGSAVLDAVSAPMPSAGLWAFTAHVDPGGAQKELREDDNYAIASARRQPDCLDLAFEAVQFDPTGYPCTEGVVHFAAQVANRGCTSSQAARVVCREAGNEIASEPLPALAAGEVALVTFTQALGSACHDFQFVLDPDGVAGNDCDMQSNWIAASACILDCPPPPPPLPIDLRVAPCNVRALETHPASGDPVRFQAWVENRGPGDATAPIFVSFKIGSVLLGDSVEVPPIAAGESVLVSAPSTWPAAFTPQVLTVYADPNGQSDARPIDNQANRPLPWDLRPADIATCPYYSTGMFSTCTPCQGIPISIRAVVLNDGLFDCDSVQVDFVDDLNGGGVIGSVMAHDVLAGSGCGALPPPVSINYAFPTTGLQRIEVVVDPHNAIVEQNETNNTRTGEVSVQCAAAPDLVAAVRLPAGSYPQPGDTVRAVEVEVRNRGTLAARAVQARLKVDGVFLCDLEMGDLQIGEANMVVCTTPWVARSGCGQILEACADPDNHIAESNENNNCSTAGTGSGETDLAVYPYSVSVTPTHPNTGDPVYFTIGIYSIRGVESSCIVTAEWRLSSQDSWHLMYATPLHLPGGYNYFPSAVAFGWVAASPTAQLRFQIMEVCPVEIEPSNNVATITLPWFEPPGTPVVVSDLEAVSTPEGVVVRWSAEPLVTAFLIERRAEEQEMGWIRLPEVVPVASSSGPSRYEVVDRDAEPGARLEYRILGRSGTGDEEVLGSVKVLHDAAARLTLQLWPVRPNPFRPGGVFEFSLPEAQPVELSVYDASGRCVATLRRGRMTSGRHVVGWDGLDSAGRRVPAGVYFCRLVSGSFQQVRRVVLLH